MASVIQWHEVTPEGMQEVLCSDGGVRVVVTKVVERLDDQCVSLGIGPMDLYEAVYECCDVTGSLLVDVVAEFFDVLDTEGFAASAQAIRDECSQIGGLVINSSRLEMIAFLLAERGEDCLQDLICRYAR